MIPTNYPLEPEATGTQPIAIISTGHDSTGHEEMKPVIGQLQSELRVLKLERAAILKRIAMIRKTLVSLADLFGPDVINGYHLLSLESAPHFRTHTGLTDLCRQLLRESSVPLTARQILGQLQERSPGVAGHRHPLNSLRMILKRLVAYGEAEELLTEEGLRAWKATSNPLYRREKSPDLHQ
jgi:hypothetical protein